MIYPKTKTSLLICLFGQSLAALGGETPSAQLNVHLVTMQGEPTGVAHLKIRDSAHRQVHDGTIASYVSLSLPVGEYEAELYGEFISTSRRSLYLPAEGALLVIGVNFLGLEQGGAEHRSSLTIHVLKPSSCVSGGRLWTRIVGAFDQQSAERLITPSGYALFDQLSSGLYILAVFDDGRVRGLTTLSVKGTHKMHDISLEPCGPSMH